jgi:ribulose-5-phosphate 4-epimerase/fuculose-1-phosphate aldolase
VAGLELPVVAESLARKEIFAPVLVAAWAPRGSPASVQNIVELLERDPATIAVLLQNHGVLVGGSTPIETARRVQGVEENAELVLRAAAIGGAQPMAADAMKATFEQKQRFIRTTRSR